MIEEDPQVLDRLEHAVSRLWQRQKAKVSVQESLEFGVVLGR